MTRIIRVELCDECPHAAGSRSCRASQWCPLEQSGPDWKPPAAIARASRSQHSERTITPHRGDETHPRIQNLVAIESLTGAA